MNSLFNSISISFSKLSLSLPWCLLSTSSMSSSELKGETKSLFFSSLCAYLEANGPLHIFFQSNESMIVSSHCNRWYSTSLLLHQMNCHLQNYSHLLHNYSQIHSIYDPFSIIYHQHQTINVNDQSITNIHQINFWKRAEKRPLQVLGTNQDGKMATTTKANIIVSRYFNISDINLSLLSTQLFTVN